MSVLHTRLPLFRLPLLLLVAMPLIAQDPVLVETPVRPAPAPVLVTMSFPGGTMAEFTARIRATESRANIVVAADAATAQLPPMELRGAGLDQALEAASIVAAAEFVVRVHELLGKGEPVYSIVAISASSSPSINAGAGGKVEDATQVFSLNRLTDGDAQKPGSPRIGFAESTILSAVEAGTQDGPRPPLLRFHRESGLLIVRGTRAQISIAKDILSNLERDVDARRQQLVTQPPTPPRAGAPAATDLDKK